MALNLFLYLIMWGLIVGVGWVAVYHDRPFEHDWWEGDE